MATAQVLTVSGSSTQSAAVQTTKVKVTSNVSVHYAVGANPTAYTGNCMVVPAGATRDINMEGLGNKIAFITTAGTAEVVVANVGYVAASTIAVVQSS
jgi:hypothetical protein